MQNTRARGFTLVEMIFTVLVGLILVAVGVPSFTNLIRSNRITASVNDVIGAYQLTRSEAAKRGLPVTLCPSANANDAEPDCAGGDWAGGYIAFLDLNGNGARDGQADTLLLARGRMSPDIFVNASAPLGGGITYGGDGFPRGLVDSTAVMVFCDEPDDARRMRVINVSATGRPVVARNIAVPANVEC
jgi:type IV fimbrial biogenesis protein FimT